MGHAGVEAIKQGFADAYWANGMRLATVTRQAIDGLNKFDKANGLIAKPAPYDRLVASQYRSLRNA